jgi:hypothetical protein
MKGVYGLMIGALCLGACNGRGAMPGSTAHAAEVLSAFTKPGADREALTRALRPKPDDYAAILVGGAARRVKVAEDRLWDAGGGKLVLLPTPEQTEIRIVSISQPELLEAEREGNRRRCLGGHARIADKLRPEAVMYCARFVKPGERLGFPGENIGFTVDVLVWVNGHWAFFPTPFPALE